MITFKSLSSAGGANDAKTNQPRYIGTNETLVPVYSVHQRRATNMEDKNTQYYQQPVQVLYPGRLSTYDELVAKLSNIEEANMGFLNPYYFDNDEHVMAASGYLEYRNMVLYCECVPSYNLDGKRTILVSRELMTDEKFKNLWKQIEKRHILPMIEEGHTVTFLPMNKLFRTIYNFNVVPKNAGIQQIEKTKEEVIKVYKSMFHSNSMFDQMFGGEEIKITPLVPEGYDIFTNLTTTNKDYLPILFWMLYDGVEINGFPYSFYEMLKRAEDGVLDAVFLTFAVTYNTERIVARYDVIDKTIHINDVKIPLMVTQNDNGYRKLTENTHELFTCVGNYFNFVLTENLNDFIEDAIDTSDDQEHLTPITP